MGLLMIAGWIFAGAEGTCAGRTGVLTVAGWIFGVGAETLAEVIGVLAGAFGAFAGANGIRAGEAVALTVEIGAFDWLTCGRATVVVALAAGVPTFADVASFGFVAAAAVTGAFFWMGGAAADPLIVADTLAVFAVGCTFLCVAVAVLVADFFTAAAGADALTAEGALAGWTVDVFLCVVGRGAFVLVAGACFWTDVAC